MVFGNTFVQLTHLRKAMAANYRTPGVYIEEISKFPPSVVAVETAIPAFLGYTESSQYKGENLTNNPVEITSLLEFETIFGLPPSIGSLSTQTAI